MIVTVKDSNAEYASRILRKRMQKAGLFEYFQEKKHFLSPTTKRKIKKAEKAKAINKYLRNRRKREGI